MVYDTNYVDRDAHVVQTYGKNGRTRSLVEKINGVIGPTLRTDEEVEEFEENGKHVIRKTETVEKLVYLPSGPDHITTRQDNYTSNYESQRSNQHGRFQSGSAGRNEYYGENDLYRGSNKNSLNRNTEQGLYRSSLRKAIPLSGSRRDSGFRSNADEQYITTVRHVNTDASRYNQGYEGNYEGNKYRENGIDVKYDSNPRLYITDDRSTEDGFIKHTSHNSKNLPSYGEFIDSKHRQKHQEDTTSDRHKHISHVNKEVVSERHVDSKMTHRDSKTNIETAKETEIVAEKETCGAWCLTNCCTLCCKIFWIILVILIILALIGVTIWLLVDRNSSSSSSSVITTTLPPGYIPTGTVTSRHFPLTGLPMPSAGTGSYTSISRSFNESSILYISSTDLKSITVFNLNTSTSIPLSTNFAFANNKQCSKCKILYLSPSCIASKMCLDSDAVYCCDSCAPGDTTNKKHSLYSCHIGDIYTESYMFAGVQFGVDSSTGFPFLSIFTKNGATSKLSAASIQNVLLIQTDANTIHKEIGNQDPIGTVTEAIFSSLIVASNTIEGNSNVWAANSSSSNGNADIYFFGDHKDSLSMANFGSNSTISFQLLPNNVIQISAFDLTTGQPFRFTAARYDSHRGNVVLKQNNLSAFKDTGLKLIDYFTDSQGNIWALSVDNSNAYSADQYIIA
uniref:TNFR-Cys domain-containing protein n=1 Tax=Rhabditophanes sp. KR3021 TaxID=114890 RepID=A0AC35U5Z6_9BILA